MQMIQDNKLKPSVGIIFLICFLAFLTGCQQIAYQPIEIDQLSKHEDAIQLSFETSKGKQVAFYIPPRTDAQSIPNPLVIIYPGIGGRALDWLSFVENSPSTTAGYLLLDYPGRGFSEGLMRPRLLPQTSQGALNALKKQLHIDQNALQKNICLCGHSFGCAAALQFAQQIPVKRIVLLAPFTTLHKAMFKKMGPLAYLNPDSLDNRKMIRDLLSRDHPPKITIIHGTLDETIPVEMGRDLVSIDDNNIKYYEIPEGTHMSITEKNRPIAYDALFNSQRKP
jgi:pimeloyl-ACP methyl ester carboxylesterase